MLWISPQTRQKSLHHCFCFLLSFYHEMPIKPHPHYAWACGQASSLMRGLGGWTSTLCLGTWASRWSGKRVRGASVHSLSLFCTVEEWVFLDVTTANVAVHEALVHTTWQLVPHSWRRGSIGVENGFAGRMKEDVPHKSSRSLKNNVLISLRNTSECLLIHSTICSWELNLLSGRKIPISVRAFLLVLVWRLHFLFWRLFLMPWACHYPIKCLSQNAASQSI